MTAEWPRRRLDEIAGLRGERIVPAKDDRRPYVALEHIASGGPLIGRSEARTSVSHKTVFCAGDTLFGKLRPNLRKVVRVDFDGVCSTDILAVFAKNPEDGPFLGHLLRSDHFHAHAMREITGTKMPRTSWEYIRAFEFPCPPPDARCGIASALDAIDDAIEHAEAVIAANERLRETLLHELLTRGVPGWHSEWKQAPGIGTVPACWDATLGSTIVRLGGGYGLSAVPASPDGDALFLKVSDLNRPGQDRYVRESSIRWDSQAASGIAAIEPPFLVFPKRGEAINSNRVAIVTVRAAVDPNLMTVQPLLDRVTPEFLRYLLLSVGLSRMSDNSGVPQINNKHIYPFSFAIPPLREQALIAGMLGAAEDSLAQNRLYARGLQDLKSAVAGALLTGRVRMPLGSEVRG